MVIGEIPLNNEVEQQAQRLRDRRAARQIVDAEGWKRPPVFGTAEEQLKNPLPPTRFIVEDLIPVDGNVSIQAQWKAGKTTLGLNLAADLVDGEAFLGEWGTALPDGRNVVYWNFEVSGSTAQGWLADLKIKQADRLHIEHWRGISLPITAKHVEDWCVRYLRKRRCGVWIIDPFGAVYTGEENSNSEVNAWLQTINRIKQRAGVSVCVLIVHTGHSGGEDGVPRARGASKLLDWPDVLVSYRHDGDQGTVPDGTTRYMGAFGRDVSLRETTLEYDEITRRLRVEHGRTRADVRIDRLKKRIMAVVQDFADRGVPLNATDLQAELGGKNDSTKTKAVRDCVRDGWVTETRAEKGPGKFYTPGPTPFRVRGDLSSPPSPIDPPSEGRDSAVSLPPTRRRGRGTRTSRDRSDKSSPPLPRNKRS